MKKELLYKALKSISTIVVYDVAQSLSQRHTMNKNIHLCSWSLRQGLVIHRVNFFLSWRSKIIQVLMASKDSLAPKLAIEFWPVTYY